VPRMSWPVALRHRGCYGDLVVEFPDCDPTPAAAPAGAFVLMAGSMADGTERYDPARTDPPHGRGPLRGLLVGPAGVAGKFGGQMGKRPPCNPSLHIGDAVSHAAGTSPDEHGTVARAAPSLQGSARCLNPFGKLLFGEKGGRRFVALRIGVRHRDHPLCARTAPALPNRSIIGQDPPI